MSLIICLCLRLFRYKLMSTWLFDRWFITLYSRFWFLKNSMRNIIDVMDVFNLMVLVIFLVT